MRTKRSPANKFLRIITIPIRALCKARNFYVKSMTGYADRMHYGNSSVMGIQGTGQVHGLPKSYSVNSARSNSNEEYRELLRAASARNVGPSDLDSFIRQQMTMRSASARRSQPRPQPQPQPQAMPPRSRSVAMGRIDEDSPCYYFGNLDNDIGKSNVVSVKNDFKYTRSRSHSVTR